MSRFACFAVLLLAGCGPAGGPSAWLIGEWQGRPETAAERLLREWPGRGAGSGAAVPGIEGPGIEVQGADAPAPPPTDLERFTDLRVELKLAAGGEAKLSLGGERPLEGGWSTTPGEGQRQLVEIEVERESEGKGGETTERRRFEVERLRKLKEADPERFTLRESGADPQFGRLLFEKK